MRQDDLLQVELPHEFLYGSLSQLLDGVFPSEEAARPEVTERFDLRANPDLPEIYAVFLAVCNEWRDWRCALRLSVDGSEVSLDSPASALVESAEDSSLWLHLEQRYSPLEYTVRHSLWESRDGLLDWMRSLTALYFLDKHEVSIEAGGANAVGPGLHRALDSLQEQGLVAPAETGELAPGDTLGDTSGDTSGDTPGDLPEDIPKGDLPEGIPSLAITPQGRRFIAGLLEETESCIELYDHYQDVLADPGRDSVEFGTVRGVDLRVQVFLAEELDPVRTVFLLRLYDGTLDARLRDWEAVIELDDFYEAVLEPVVNRDSVAPEEMERVIEFGYVWLDERQERERRDATDRELLRRAGGEAPDRF